ncbi:MAG: phosphoribosylanthranilate isomerase [Clostridium sp.]|jgi:phosphoribosylanthranilate isomerase|nr:phosphoribosylanthranilate isomerase [Clostridium sp.]
MKVKICGLRTQTDVEYANAARPDYVGFVFAPSKRRITYEQAAQLRKHLSPEIRSVGVFVDTPNDEILRLIYAKIIDVVQLHGKEQPCDLAYVKDRCDALTMKALRFAAFDEIKSWEDSVADFLLFDSTAGSGTTFDWTKLEHIRKKPFFVAGGLNENNISEAALQLRPYGVDVSSGVERNGAKDLELMQRFVKKARQYNGFV